MSGAKKIRVPYWNRTHDLPNFGGAVASVFLKGTVALLTPRQRLHAALPTPTRELKKPKNFHLFGLQVGCHHNIVSTR